MYPQGLVFKFVCMFYVCILFTYKKNVLQPVPNKFTSNLSGKMYNKEMSIATSSVTFGRNVVILTSGDSSVLREMFGDDI